MKVLLYSGFMNTHLIGSASNWMLAIPNSLFLCFGAVSFYTHYCTLGLKSGCWGITISNFARHLWCLALLNFFECLVDFDSVFSI